MSTREENLKKRKLPCLKCGREMHTDRCHRVCRRCHRKKEEKGLTPHSIAEFVGAPVEFNE